MATWHTIHGHGPFAMLSQSVATRVLNVQSYNAFLSLFVLILLAGVAWASLSVLLERSRRHVEA